MSAASRALMKLADHEQRMADKHARDFPDRARLPIYDGVETWELAADMARRTAQEQRWRERIPRFVRRRVLRRSIW